MKTIINIIKNWLLNKSNKNNISKNNNLNLLEDGISHLKKLHKNKSNKKTINIISSSYIYFNNLAKEKNVATKDYYFMAYIFYLIKEFNYSLKYLEIVEMLDPNFFGLNELKQNLVDFEIIKDNSEVVIIKKNDSEIKQLIEIKLYKKENSYFNKKAEFSFSF
ncbi:MAG: hypothetical protein U0457_17755 [Candidatus Sericytochromatia bacterium]